MTLHATLTRKHVDTVSGPVRHVTHDSIVMVVNGRNWTFPVREDLGDRVRWHNA